MWHTDCHKSVNSREVAKLQILPQGGRKTVRGQIASVFYKKHRLKRISIPPMRCERTCIHERLTYHPRERPGMGLDDRIGSAGDRAHGPKSAAGIRLWRMGC